MSRPATVPRELSFEPFSGSRAIAAGLITRRMLNGPSWRRILPDVYVHKSSYDPDDYRMWCTAATVGLPPGAAIHELSAAFLWGPTSYRYAVPGWRWYRYTLPYRGQSGRIHTPE